MRVVVLGSGGYLGRAAADELERALDRKGVVHMRDIADLAASQIRIGADDVILNCAGYYGPDARKLREANVKHVRGVVELADTCGARLVHVSSSAVFDGIVSGEISEHLPVYPRSPYGRSKADGERIVAEITPHARIVRLPKLFGGEDPRRRLHKLVRHVRSRRILPMPDRPALWANFVWNRDAARLLAEEVVEPSPEPIVHLASPLPWQKFVCLLEEVTARSARRAPRPVEASLRAVVPLLERAPPQWTPRFLARLLELWDRQMFRDARGLLDSESVLAGLRDVADRIDQ